MDWLDLLAVQGTLKSLLQHHNSKALVLWCSTLLIVQLSHPSSGNWKKHSFDYTDLFGKVMSLLFNMLARSVIAFLPRSKPLLISWLQSYICPFRIYWASVTGEILCFKPKLKWCIIDLFTNAKKKKRCLMNISGNDRIVLHSIMSFKNVSRTGMCYFSRVINEIDTCLMKSSSC